MLQLKQHANASNNIVRIKKKPLQATAAKLLKSEQGKCGSKAISHIKERDKYVLHKPKPKKPKELSDTSIPLSQPCSIALCAQDYTEISNTAVQTPQQRIRYAQQSESC